MDYAWLLPSIIFLILLFICSAFFSSSETALTSVSRAKMHARAQDGDWRAALVNKILDQKDRLIGAILLGNNTVNTLAAAISTSVLIKMFGEAGVYYATIAITILLLVFGEVLPKTYAIYHSEKIALLIAPIINVLVYVATPVTVAVSVFVRFLLGLFGVRIDNAKVTSDVEELRGAIELHQGPGAETKERRDMLRSILNLTDVTVDEVMTHRKLVDMVNYDQPVPQVVDEIMSYNHTRIPLWSDTPENIIGIVHVKQMLSALYEANKYEREVDVGALMLRPWFVPNTTRLVDQLQAFRERREHFAVVIDEYGSFMGVVTLEDILEEIVGEIDDEQDLVVPGVRKMPDGSYLVNGDLSIRDLNRELNWDLPDDEDYTTAAGLVLYESRRIPEEGMAFSFHGYQFDIMKRQRNQIVLLRILPMEQATPA